MINKRSLLKVIVLFMVSTFIGVAIVVGLRKWHVDRLGKTTFTPLPITFETKPPRNALVGRLATSSAEVFQGDVVTTDATTSSTIIFDSLGQIDVGPNADLTLSNMMSDQLLLWQKGGTITYNLPASVRFQHALVHIASGSATITYESSRYVIVEIASGSASIAYQDADQNTFIKPLISEKSNVYDDNLRRLIYKKITK